MAPETTARVLGAGGGVRLYTWLLHRCFTDCVTTFYRKTLGKREGDCVHACVRKYTLATNPSATADEDGG
ncbi:Mitochondrial import inner membrane translocase subunit Tim9 [Hordeum vulgare]|nr:Mitochondrial import inner membrane translocase subunit Tim9 [Hordeum vulgare]